MVAWGAKEAYTPLHPRTQHTFYQTATIYDKVLKSSPENENEY
jgi:hypothetical protein